MARLVLLVGGSRALAEVPAAEGWARGLLLRRIRALPRGSVVLVGGEPGPEAWAGAAAGAAGLRWVRFDRAGVRAASWQGPGRWAPAGVHPHRLHQRLVDAAVAARAAGWQVCVLVLCAGWSRSDGTGSLLRRAARAGLSPERLLFTAPL